MNALRLVPKEKGPSFSLKSYAWAATHIENRSGMRKGLASRSCRPTCLIGWLDERPGGRAGGGYGGNMEELLHVDVTHLHTSMAPSAQLKSICCAAECEADISVSCLLPLIPLRRCRSGNDSSALSVFHGDANCVYVEVNLPIHIHTPYHKCSQHRLLRILRSFQGPYP